MVLLGPSLDAALRGQGVWGLLVRALERGVLHSAKGGTAQQNDQKTVIEGWKRGGLR